MTIDTHNSFAYYTMFPLEIQEETAIFTGFFPNFVEWARLESKQEAIRTAIYFFLHFLRRFSAVKSAVKMRGGADKAKI